MGWLAVWFARIVEEGAAVGVKAGVHGVVPVVATAGEEDRTQAKVRLQTVEGVVGLSSLAS